MKISVIVPTYNEIAILEDCLESLGSQTETDFEIIIVDDGSTDSTSQMLRGASNTFPSFQFFIQEHMGAGVARNLGAKHASGEILVFIDADMTFDENFLKNLVKPIIDGKTNGTFSKEEYVSNWNNVWARCWNINEGWEPKRRHPKDYPDHQPVFRAVLRKEFERAGGFTPGGYDDDWSLGRKLGYDAVNAPGAIFYHKNPSSLIEIFRHAKWVGKRRYKFGVLGYVIALIRVLLPFSIIVGIYKSLVIFNLSNQLCCQFLIFKIVYDFGIFVGILEVVLVGKSSK